MHYAACKGYEAPIRALVAAKADVYAKDKVRVRDGKGLQGGGGVGSVRYYRGLEI